jgi:hypothetical protein
MAKIRHQHTAKQKSSTPMAKEEKIVYYPTSKKKKIATQPGTVAHTCNPSYPGGRDQEDGGLKPALANSWRDPISKKPITKKGSRVEWLKV